MAQYHVSIIGAGSSGLMAAHILAQKGFKVSVFEQAAAPARKLLLAGLGGLNLTHSEPLDLFLSRYRCSEPELLYRAIRNFPPEVFIDWCHRELEISTFVGTSHRVFPVFMKAAPFLRQWIILLKNMGVQFHFKTRWEGWSETGKTALFTQIDQSLLEIQPDAMLFALGGASWPRIGTDGQWVIKWRERDIHIKPFNPSNMGLLYPWSDTFLDRFEGQPVKSVTFSYNQQILQGEALITRSGLQGTPIYTLSSSIKEALDHGESVTLYIDLKPSLSKENIILKLSQARKKDSLSSKLRKQLNLSPLHIGLLYEAYLHRTLPPDFETLARSIKALPLIINGTQGLERAISSSGGVYFSELDQNFMIKKIPGVFAAGEMLDWDAPTGGYLLQACFSTGYEAAQGISRYLIK